MQQMFQLVALAFNNEHVVIDTPEEAADIAHSETIDLNDMSQMRITCDCKFNCLIIHFLISYLTSL